MQETKDMVIGLELGEQFAQLTYYNSTMKDPVTPQMPGAVDEDRCLIPVDRKVWESACGLGQPIELIREFLQKCLGAVVTQHGFKTLRIMVTVPKLEPLLAQRVPQALELLGVQRKNIYMQDYMSSFYHYAVRQKRELWNGDVALLECVGDVMVGYVLHIDYTKSPALVSIERAASQAVDEKARDGRDDAGWNRERDRLFFELLKKVFERRNVVTAYLLGDYFSREWADKSFRFLCTRRHAFQGKNLFTKGACYAAMERCGLLKGMDLLFMGSDIIRDNLGMNLRVRGKEMYYPLVTAGINWYEAHHECEFVPDDDTTINIISKPMTGGEEVQHLLRLNHFPDRSNRATRLRMTVYFTGPGVCCVEVEDLGFGGFYRSSHQKWQRKIHLGGKS